MFLFLVLLFPVVPVLSFLLTVVEVGRFGSHVWFGRPGGLHLSHGTNPEPGIHHLVLPVPNKGLFLLYLVDQVIVQTLK